MGKSVIQDYMDKFSQNMVRFNPYAIRKTGLLQNQTFLKIDDYMLITAPFQLSMTRAIMLVILSRQEADFFKKFRSKIGSINFTFQKPTRRNPINFFVRATLERIGPVKGKDSVCLFDFTYKTCPNDLVEILGDYITNYATLRSQFETFKNRQVQVTQETAEQLRFNQFVEFQANGTKVRPQLVSLAVNRLVLDLPASTPGLEVGAKRVAKLYFQTYQFMVTGEIISVSDPFQSRLRVQFDIDFAAELVEILDDYFYRESMEPLS